MTAYRKKPAIGKTVYPKREDDPMGCVKIPIITVISYFVFSAIVRTTSNSGSELDQVICYGALICFVVIMFLGAKEHYQEHDQKYKERMKWATSCKIAQLNIVYRREEESWWEDYDNRFHRIPNLLDLEMNSDQKAAFPNQTTVRVEVSGHVYNKLRDRKTVSIYYMPGSPLTFLLKEEL